MLNQLNWNRKTVFIAITILCILVLGGVRFWATANQGDALVIDLSESPDNGSDVSSLEGDDEAKEDQPEEAVDLVVYISGGVLNPGVYILPPGSRVHELIEEAGGAKEDARLELLNLAAQLEADAHIHIYRAGDDIEKLPAGLGVSMDASGSHGRVNINTADAQELQGLPGIGPVRGESIVRHRENNGPFTSTQELTEVHGIGEGTLAQLQDLITVE